MNEITIEPTEWLMVIGKGRDKGDIIILENVMGTFRVYRKATAEITHKDGIEVIRVV